MDSIGFYKVLQDFFPVMGFCEAIQSRRLETQFKALRIYSIHHLYPLWKDYDFVSAEKGLLHIN